MPFITSIPADFNFLKLFPAVNLLGSFIAQTTFVIFDFIIRSTQGGHFPQLLHGSRFTYKTKLEISLGIANNLFPSLNPFMDCG